MVEVVATAKIDLSEGQVVDGLGHYMTYGLCENSGISKTENLLPLGLAEGCTLKRSIPKDQVLTYNDVILPEGRLCDEIRKEQEDFFS